MSHGDSVQAIALQFDLPIKPGDFAANTNLLAVRINELIEHHFQRLISILYRLDVPEEKLKRLLKENKDQDAGFIIANLIVERHEEKIKSREQFSKRDPGIDENEKW